VELDHPDGLSHLDFLECHVSILPLSDLDKFGHGAAHRHPRALDHNDQAAADLVDDGDEFSGQESQRLQKLPRLGLPPISFTRTSWPFFAFVSVIMTPPALVSTNLTIC
jgi:hypothetical protein